MFKSREKRLVLVVMVLLVLGIVMVFSASWPYAVDIGQDPEYFLIRQIIAAIIGIFALILTSLFPYRIYKKLAIPIFILSTILCMLLFTPLGDSYGTFARRWLSVGPISFMPSDIHKVACVIIVAAFLSSRKENLTFLKDMVPLLILIGICVLPIYLQPNFSTVILIIGVLLSMYVISGMKLSYLLAFVPIGILAFIFFFAGESNAYRRERVRAMFNPLEDYLGSGWQLSQALFAVSSGGLFGVGIGRSRQKHLYLSEAHNDFIFAIIAEELGLVGCAFIIIGFVIIIKIGLDIAKSSKDKFGKLLAAGITLMIGFQAFINMGVSVGLVPPTGLVLPFISYGGTSLVINLAMVGILINISRSNRRRL